MMKGNSKVNLLLTALWINFVFGCNQRADHSTAKYSDSLIVYSGAKDVKFSKYAGTDVLTYRVHEKFPASGIIGWISHKLEEKGWKPLTNSYLNPDTPSSHVKGWVKFIDATEATRHLVHQWDADWKERSENIVTYVFQYKYPESGNPNLTDLKVTAIYTPAPLAKQGREAAQKFVEEYYKEQKVK